MRTCPFEAERNKFPLQGVRDLTWGRRAASSARTTSAGCKVRRRALGVEACSYLSDDRRDPSPRQPWAQIGTP